MLSTGPGFICCLFLAVGASWLHTLFGENYIHYWSDFSDDSMAVGADEDECLLRYNILGCIKTIMVLYPQLKRSRSSSTKKHWAGLVWSVKSICISDTVRVAILEVCGVTPRGTSQMRRLRGIIQSGILGFDLSAGQLRAFADLMAPMNAAITATGTIGKYSWPADAKSAQEAISMKMSNSPKAYTYPDLVVDEHHSVMQLGDGDPLAVCSGIISFPVADARDITLEMTHSGAVVGCVLVAMYFQMLNNHQQKWGMYEIETFARVVCHRKAHKYFNELMSKFNRLTPAPGSNGEVSGGMTIARLKYASDNSTALGMIPSFTIPEEKIDHLTAKFHRLCHWCEEFHYGFSIFDFFSHHEPSFSAWWTRKQENGRMVGMPTSTLNMSKRSSRIIHVIFKELSISNTSVGRAHLFHYTPTISL